MALLGELILVLGLVHHASALGAWNAGGFTTARAPHRQCAFMPSLIRHSSTSRFPTGVRPGSRAWPAAGAATVTLTDSSPDSLAKQVSPPGGESFKATDGLATEVVTKALGGVCV
jgi:hypothetical protein